MTESLGFVSAEASGLCVVVRAAGQLCALPLEHVDETMRPLPIRVLAGMPPFVRGVGVIRGTPVPVVDAGSLVDDAASARPPTRFVVVKSDARRVALAVDEVIGIRAVSPAQQAAMPPLLGAAGEHHIASLGRLDRELLLVLRSGRLVPDSVWAALDTGRPS